MPITKEELKQYSVYLGTNPMPEDFDVFWDARVEEARQIPLKYHLSASEIPDFDTCRFMDLEFTGIRWEQLYAKYLLPASNKPVPLVLQFHGYPGASRSWLEQASFAGMGCALLAMDCPGQGGR